jgi:hypothetical protein
MKNCCLVIILVVIVIGIAPPTPEVFLIMADRLHDHD